MRNHSSSVPLAMSMCSALIDWGTLSSHIALEDCGKLSACQGHPRFQKAARCGWLMPVIPAIWKAGTGKIVVSDKPGKKKFTRPHLNGKKLGMIAATM